MAQPFVDELGRTWKTFGCSYWHDDAWWTFQIKAPDWDDARARVAKLGSAKLDGELVATIPCTPNTVGIVGAIVTIFCDIANRLRKLLRLPGAR